MHQRTFLLVSILTVGLVLWLLQPHFGAPAGPRGLRLGSLYLLWAPELPLEPQPIDGLWLVRQTGGGVAAFLNLDPYGGPLLWSPAALTFQAQLSRGSYGVDGRGDGESCAGDLCRLRAEDRGGGLVLVWERRYLGGTCPM